MATSQAIRGISIRGHRAPVGLLPLEQQIADFTAHRLSLNPRRVIEAARLREDLGLADDDAIGFFEAFAAEFQVDMDSLFSRYWARHFGPFGIGWGTLFLMFATASSAGFLAGFGAPAEAWLLWGSLALLELVVLQGRPFLSAEINLVPIRVSDLVRAARQGFWREPGVRQRRRRGSIRRRKDPAAFGPILVQPSQRV